MTTIHDDSFHSCDAVLDYICSQFGDDPDSERCQAVKRHLDRCPDCASYCTSMERMIGLYRAASPFFPAEARSHLLNTLGIRDETEPAGA
jgi:hypothetical protein